MGERERRKRGNERYIKSRINREIRGGGVEKDR